MTIDRPTDAALTALIRIKAVSRQMGVTDQMEDAMSRRPPLFSRPNDLHGEDALDAALAASFPASDPVAALVPAGERSLSARRRATPRVDHSRAPPSLEADVQP